MSPSDEARAGIPTDIPGYRILRPIAAGGMGSVYEAEKLTTHEHFAVKFIRGQFLDDKTYRARFEREVKAMRAIRHPNVVDLFEWHLPSQESGGLPFVVMELLKGRSLETPLRRSSAMPWTEAVPILLQVLDGLTAAHAVGVLHRDLGPSNIFLLQEPDERVHVKLLDFGLARPLEGEESHPGVTQEGTWLGKPAYVAPEMFRSLTLDERADVFACGMVLFRMLAGRFPYKETKAQLLWMERYAERDQPPTHPPPSTFAGDAFPAELDRIVARAIAKRRDERYATAREMQAELLRFEQKTVPEPTPITLPPATVRTEPSGSSVVGGRATPVVSGRRRRIRPPVLAAAVVGLALVVAVLLLLSRRQSSAPSSPAVVPEAPVAAAQDGAAPPVAGPIVPAVVPAPAAAGDAAQASPVAADPRGAEAGTGGVSVAGPAEAASSGVDASSAEPPTVRLVLEGVPDGAEVLVDGVPAPQSEWIDLPVSDVAVLLEVTVPGGRWEPWEEGVVPDVSRTVEVRMRRVRGAGQSATSGRDVGTERDGGIQGRFGTVFSTSYDDPP